MLRLESNKLTVLLTSCCVYSMRSHVGSIASSNLWTNIVHALAQSGVIDALHADVELLNNGDKSEDASVLVHLLSFSRNHGYVSLCRQLHGYVVKHGFVSESRLSNSLMRFYKGSDSLEDSHKVSDEMLEQDTISWNSLAMSLWDTVYWNVIVASCSRNNRLEPRTLVFPSDAKSRHCNIQRAHKCFRQSRRFQQCFSDSIEFA
ncbi:unnamed protein product [Brassica napus]|uniref:(rape) hypothetical protein n=1 Tax=Brassica napus TaxID=3708 RepID=A0A816MPR9_BRANA|nr:unnamed protein product [Brassica napus]